ncbi:MAG: bifunctional precorrin-2 dehydrogenase/sirohydrochlorin ferrochelatase [Lewinellaceae bacterium]|nr:bifunctional precorrin-2 dehydrogenase/sirohydrochlorin ferrochelatase [Lewinellaceae bacterium]
MSTRNNLYPVFLQASRLHFLLVGAGEVGSEKMGFLLKSSPDAKLTVVATWVSEQWQEIRQQHSTAAITLCERPFVDSDIEGHDVIIAATNDATLNHQVYQAAKARGKLVNVADTPALCDFYMGAIVSRGPLKIAISTNGQSPTFAKRLRQWLEAILPAETATLLQKLQDYRNTLPDDFAGKVARLDALTSGLLAEQVPTTTLADEQTKNQL